MGSFKHGLTKVESFKQRLQMNSVKICNMREAITLPVCARFIIVTTRMGGGVSVGACTVFTMPPKHLQWQKNSLLSFFPILLDPKINYSGNRSACHSRSTDV